MQDHEQKIEEAAKKGAYATPKLTEFGSVVQLTNGSTGSKDDGQGGLQPTSKLPVTL